MARNTPTLVGEFTGSLPERTRSGYWKDMFKSTFQPNPGTRYEFSGVSASTATNLRRDYGLDAYVVTETVAGENGEEPRKVTRLIVQYLPAEVERIQRETRERGEARKATIAKNKAAKEREAAKAGSARK